MKSKLKLFLVLGLMVGIFSCSETIDADEETPEPEVPTGGTPVETAPANTNYQPAFFCNFKYHSYLCIKFSMGYNEPS